MLVIGILNYKHITFKEYLIGLDQDSIKTITSHLTLSSIGDTLKQCYSIEIIGPKNY